MRKAGWRPPCRATERMQRRLPPHTHPQRPVRLRLQGMTMTYRTLMSWNWRMPCQMRQALHAAPSPLCMLCHIPLRQAFALEGKDIASCCSLTLHVKLAVSGIRASVCMV